MPQTAFTVRCGKRLLDLSRQQVMGILNLTPDSFYDGGRWQTEKQALQQAAQLLEDGAAIIDIGGVSTRPNAPEVSPEEEYQRVIPIVEAVVHAFPQAIISIDTFRAAVAKAAILSGAHIINDVSAGRWDNDLLPTVAQLQVPYILMHAQGTPQTMQQSPHYENVLTDIYDFLIHQVADLQKMGIKEIIIDLGFGFGKTLENNYRLLQNLHLYQQMGFPILVGLSRKSMIWKALGITPEQALNGTTALHWQALEQGARILRVHDVRQAVETIKLWELTKGIVQI